VPGKSTFDLAALRRRAATVWSGFTSGQKTMLMLAMAAVVIGGYFFTKWAGQPTLAPLYNNLSQTDAGSITTQLSSKGVGYQLADGGATIMVPEAQVYQLRLDMSAKGLPTGGSQGYSLLDKQGITTSEFNQRVDYQRALEGELARTIGAIDGVQGADVHLVIPTDDVFAADSQKPSASVLLKAAPGKKFSSDQVRSIVNLVAGSVQGLDPTAVTVADSSGHTLSAPGDDGLGASGDQATQTATFEDSLARSIEDLLSPVTGQGGSVVKVTADLNFDQRSTTTESFATPPAGQTAPVVSSNTSKETFSGPGAAGAAGGVLGTTNGQAQTATQGAASSANSYEKDSSDQSFAVGKVTEQVKSAPGSVNRLSVAVLVDNKVKAAPAELSSLVSAAAGIDAKRGDVVTVSQLAFDHSEADAAAKEQKAAAAEKAKTQLLGLVRTVGVLLIVLVALFLAWRSARKAGVTRYPMPGVLPAGPVQAEALQAALSALHSGDGYELPDGLERRSLGGDRPPAALPSAPDVNDELAELIDRQPDEVAQILRGWLADRRQ